MNTAQYFFQNPNSGIPVVLEVGTSGRPTVSICADDVDDATEHDLTDMWDMCAAVREINDLHDAARLLRREYGATDILG